MEFEQVYEEWSAVAVAVVFAVVVAAVVVAAPSVVGVVAFVVVVLPLPLPLPLRLRRPVVVAVNDVVPFAYFVLLRMDCDSADSFDFAV